VANGVATLDGSGKVPVSELPAAVLGALSYQGTWDASTNTPTLTSSVGTKGYYYVVNVAGNTNLNGITDWLVGDWAVYNGTVWQKVDNTDAVTSVNGLTGAVVLTTTNIAEGTNLYYTDVRARAAISAGTGISYDNTTGVVTNAAPDQTVALTDGTAIDVTGTYPNFTINNTAPDQTVVLTAGTGISTSGTYPNFTIANTAPSLGGDVVGPASATDNAVARYDTTTGKLLQNSVVLVGDTGVVTGVTELTASTKVVSPHFDAQNSAGGQLRNASGTPQLQWGGGGGNNISVDVAININPANAQVDLSPTGTGVVRIAPATAGTMNNMVIGGTTPLAGNFTDLSVTGTTSFDGSQGTSGQVLTSQGTGVTPIWTTPTVGTVTSVSGTGTVSGISLSGTVTSSGNLTLGGSLDLSSPPAIGGTTPAAGNFTTLGATGVATFSAGTVSAPAITTTGDTNTGIFFPAADTIAFTEGGVESMRIDSSGNLSIGSASLSTVRLVTKGSNTASDSYAFLARNSADANILAITNAGNVGINTSTPKGIFDVVGTGSSSSNNWVYISGGNVGAANPAAGFAGGLAIATNYSSGNSETNLVWGQTTGSGQYLSISKWTGSVVTEQMRITSTGTLAVVSKVTAPNLQGPAFSAYKSAGAGNQTITSGIATKVTFDTEVFDTNSNFASSTFTPTVAGYYQISAAFQPEPSTAATRIILATYKNGSLFGILQDWAYTSATFVANKASGSQLIEMNGTTDTVEIYVWIFATTAIIGSGQANTWFTGSMVRST
jgi:hypothetical protein